MHGAVFFLAKQCRLVPIKMLEWTSIALLCVSALPYMPKIKPVGFLGGLFVCLLINETIIAQFIRQATTKPPNFWVYKPTYIHSIQRTKTRSVQI